MDATPDNSLTAARDAVAGLLSKMGYRAEIMPGDRMIASAAAGLKFSVIVPSEENLQFYMSMTLSKSNVDAADLNGFNAEFRFVKAYLDKDADLALECDFLFYFDKPGAPEVFGEYLRIWENALSEIKRFIAQTRLKKAQLTATELPEAAEVG